MKEEKTPEIDFTKCHFINYAFPASCLTKALKYLPVEIQEWVSNNTAFFSTFGKRYGSRLSPTMCSTKEIIYLSEKTFPLDFIENSLPTQYFIFVVLHEVAHAKFKHDCDNQERKLHPDNDPLESEANKQAITWFNLHTKNNGLNEISMTEINAYKAKMGEIIDLWDYHWKEHLKDFLR